ncbi:MAG: hypothetical protein MUP71_07650 [Candidatus Aminicenantes bacterium]|nr:hypothetical protein [Candidatus Aminicenantes bacterium]
MSIWLMLALIFAPAVFWIGYAYFHDRCKPEPLVMAAFSYFLGFLPAGFACALTASCCRPWPFPSIRNRSGG